MRLHDDDLMAVDWSGRARMSIFPGGRDTSTPEGGKMEKKEGIGIVEVEMFCGKGEGCCG